MKCDGNNIHAMIKVIEITLSLHFAEHLLYLFLDCIINSIGICILSLLPHDWMISFKSVSNKVDGEGMLYKFSALSLTPLNSRCFF